MSTTEQEFLWKVTEILGECEELKEMIPDEWPDEAKKQAQINIDLIVRRLTHPHSGLSLLEYSPEDGSSLTLHISKDPPQPECAEE